MDGNILGDGEDEMNKDTALDLALEALEEAHYKVEHKQDAAKREQAITAIKQARALDKMADNARELGLDYEPVQEPVANDWSVFNTGAEVWGGLSLADAVAELTPERLERGWSAVCVINKDNPPVYTAPSAKPAPDLQAELEATNRQVEILSDALAESRREIAQLKSQRAPVQEPVAKPKLIGWRTADFLNETTDIRSARNWEVHYEVLPIFEGDPNTKLATPPAAQRQWVGLTEEEREQHRDDWHANIHDKEFRAIEAKLKEKNT